MEETTNFQAIEEKKRPSLLAVLCILTFIANGLGILIYLLLTVAFGAFSTMLSGIPGLGAMIASGGIALFASSLIISVATLFGAIKMWQMKKMGFFIYVGAQVIGLIVPIIFGLGFSFVGFIFTALFVVLYGLNLKHME